MLAGLGFLAYVISRAVKTQSTREWLFIALLPFSIYPTSAAIGAGQVTVHCLVALLGCLFLLRSSAVSWWRDVLAAVLFIAALAKPTVTAPFYWVVLFLPNRLRPIVLVSVGYLAAMVFAASFQQSGLWELLRAWRGQESIVRVDQGHTNISGWLEGIGLNAAIIPVALLTLVALGLWVWRHRTVDFWLLVGIVGLGSRLWIHHRATDDLLMVLPMIPLLRLAEQGATNGSDVTAGLLFGLAWITLIAPTNYLRWLPGAGLPTQIWLAAVWLSVLIFLLKHAGRQDQRLSAIPSFRPPTVSVCMETTIERATSPTISRPAMYGDAAASGHA